MNHRRSSLSFRVRYEGRVRDTDRRPVAKTKPASLHYIVARTLSPFRAKWQLKTDEPVPAAKA